MTKIILAGGMFALISMAHAQNTIQNGSGSGNVGLGTSSPVKLLDVRGSSTFGGGITESAFQWSANSNERPMILTGNAAGGIYSYGTFMLGSNDNEGTDQTLGLLLFGQKVSGKSQTNSGLKAMIRGLSSGSGGSNSGYGGNLLFCTTSDNSSTIIPERMRIDMDGNVGIGTSSPGARLHSVSTNLGILGEANSASGIGIGVYGNSTSSAGIGIKGTGITGVYGDGTTGVYGKTSTAGAAGVMGESTGFSGTGIGVYGNSNSASGIGVKGSGITGIYGEGTTGIYGKTSTGGAVGVKGEATSGAGVQGNATGKGVEGNASSGGGIGVQGNANVINGIGVQGNSNSSTGVGVQGIGGTYGVDGYGPIGLRGNSYGSGYTGIGKAVVGNASSSATNYAGFFQGIGGPSGVTSYGVYCEATNPTLGGTNYGIYSSVGAVTYGGSGPSYAGYFNGDLVVAAGCYYPSDRRIKKDIVKLSGSMDIINKLNPVTYNFNTADNKNIALPTSKQYGFISQEIQEIMPELTTTIIHPAQFDDNGKEIAPAKEILGLNYNGFIAILAKGIQEQQTMINQQTQINADLQNQLNEQKQLISNLQKTSGSTGINSLGNVETGFQMSQNEPNPFTHETIVKYTLPQTVNSASMVVYDLTGKQITSIPVTERGTSSITITSEKLAAGIYIYSIVADGKVMDSKRMIVAEK